MHNKLPKRIGSIASSSASRSLGRYAEAFFIVETFVRIQRARLEEREEEIPQLRRLVGENTIAINLRNCFIHGFRG